MVLMSAEPIIFLFMFCLSIMINLGQKFILDRLCVEKTGIINCTGPTTPINTSFSPSTERNFPTNSYAYEYVKTLKDNEGYEMTWKNAGDYKYKEILTSYVSHDDIRSEAVQLYMAATTIIAISSIISSQFLGYWMDRMSRKVLMIFPTGGGMAWAMACMLVAYFETCPVQLIFIGVFLGGITGGYVTLKAAVTSYIVQETPPEKITTRLSVVEAAIFLGSAAGLLSMNVTMTYITTNYAYLFMGVQGGYILIFLYIVCFLTDDAIMDYPHMRYTYDELDGASLLNPQLSQCSYGSLRISRPALNQRFISCDSLSKTERDNKNESKRIPEVQVERYDTEVGSGFQSSTMYTNGDSSFHFNTMNRPIPSLAIPIKATKAISVNSIYGTPPDIIITEMDKTSPEETNLVYPLLETTGSMNTIYAYGTPPQVMPSIGETGVTDSDTQLSYDDKSNEELLLRTSFQSNPEEFNETLCGLACISQTQIVLKASVDEYGEITRLGSLDKMSSLTKSTIPIQSHKETRSKDSTINSSQRRKHTHPSKYTSDSALGTPDTVSNCLKMFVDGQEKHSRRRLISVSTPESLNYLAFSEYKYTDQVSSFCSQDNLCTDDLVDEIRVGLDEVDSKSRDSWCTAIFRGLSDSVATTFKSRPNGLRSMIIAVVIANFFVSFVLIAENDNTFLYLNHKFNWDFSKYLTYFGIKCAVDGCSLVAVLPLLRRLMSMKNATLGVLGGLSRSAFFFMLALVQYSSQVYAVPFIGFFGQYLFVAERAIMSSLVDEDEQGRVFTVLSSVDQLALLLGALTFDNLFSIFIKESMPGVTLLIAGFVVLIPTVIFGALYFSMKSREKIAEDEKDSGESCSLANQSYLSSRSYGTYFD